MPVPGHFWLYPHPYRHGVRPHAHRNRAAAELLSGKGERGAAQLGCGERARLHCSAARQAPEVALTQGNGLQIAAIDRNVPGDQLDH